MVDRFIVVDLPERCTATGEVFHRSLVVDLTPTDDPARPRVVAESVSRLAAGHAAGALNASPPDQVLVGNLDDQPAPIPGAGL
jgi:hypothetical protein